MEDIIFFGGISYLWHAWVDPEDITNQFVNSVTILKGKDNIWNEDFHVVHHTSPSTHWTNYPKHFEGELAFLFLFLFLFFSSSSSSSSSC
jgi:hypothetical protein